MLQLFTVNTRVKCIGKKKMEKRQKSKPMMDVTVDQPQERYLNLYHYCHLTPLLTLFQLHNGGQF